MCNNRKSVIFATWKVQVWFTNYLLSAGKRTTPSYSFREMSGYAPPSNTLYRKGSKNELRVDKLKTYYIIFFSLMMK